MDFNVAQSVMLFSSQSSKVFLTISLASSINPSDSLTYTKPLDIISGPATIVLVSLDKVTTTVNIPSWDKCFLSLNTIFPTSPTPRPSTNICPEITVPFS